MSEEGVIDQQSPSGALAVYQQFEGQLQERAQAIASMLPRHVSKERFLSVALSAVKQNPQLLNCTVRSLIGAITKAAQDGLLADGREGVITDYNTKVSKRGQPDRWAKMAQWNPMVYGLRKRARELDGIIIDAQVVYENDVFDWEQGDNPHITHKSPPLGQPRGKMLGAYAIFKREDGIILHREVMCESEIEDVRAQSKAKESLMWTKFKTEGWRKSVIRRGIKTVPVSETLEQVVRRDDDLFDFGQARVQDVITAQPPSPPPAPQPAPKAITNAPGTPVNVVEPIPDSVEAELDRAALRQMNGGADEYEPGRARLMADFYAVRKGDALYPDSVESAAVFSKLPFGKPMRVEAKQPRNIGRHRLYWALCHRIANGIDVSSENISDVLKIASGHYTLVHTKTHGDVKLPKSIAFHNMDETAFQDFFERCVRTVYEEWGVDPASIADLLAPQEASAA